MICVLNVEVVAPSALDEADCMSAPQENAGPPQVFLRPRGGRPGVARSWGCQSLALALSLRATGNSQAMAPELTAQAITNR